jgi:hypothetical protein
MSAARTAIELDMSEPPIIRCQCRNHCTTWIRLDGNDVDLLSDGLAAVHPGHAKPTEPLSDIRPGYLIVHRPTVPARQRVKG